MTTPPKPPYASLYVGDLSPDVTEGLLWETFSRIGQIFSIRVCRDSLTRRSLQYAYVNFHNVVDAERALEALNNQHIKGKPCRIMWSQRDPSIRKSGVGNIFIKDLDPSVEHKELYEIFSIFGTILSCKIATDDRGRSKGYGFVHFDNEEAAERAIHSVNGKLIKTKQVYVANFVSKRERVKLADASWTNVYVKDIDPEVSDQQFREKFSQFGSITSSEIMRDDSNRASKGFGFVNYESHESAVKAVSAMNGQTIGSKPIWCGRAQKKNERDAVLKKNIEQKKLARITQSQGTNLYIKNLEDEIDENRLRQEFSPWGTIKSLKIMKDDKTNLSRGFGFISYATPDEAKRAITEMNTRILQGCNKPLYVALHEVKEIRRSKIEQYQASRKIPRMPATQPPYNMYPFPIPPPPHYVYPPQQMVPPPWPNHPYPPVIPVPAQPPPLKNPVPRQPVSARTGSPSGQIPGGRGPKPNSARRTQVESFSGTPPSMEHHPHHQIPLQRLPPEQQRRWLGESLYAQIAQLQPNLAGKITGMFLDSGWSVEDLYSLLINPESLKSKIGDALRVLEQNVQGNT